MWNINAPAGRQGRIPRAIFTKLAAQDALAVKNFVGFAQVKGLWSYGGFKLTGSDYPEIFSAP